MSTLRTAGILWLVAGLLAIAIALIFRVDSTQVVVTIAGGAVAAVLGLWFLARPSPATVPVSSVVGLGWLVLYAALTVQQSGEIAAWTTDVFLAVVGLGAALAAYRAKRQAVRH